MDDKEGYTCSADLGRIEIPVELQPYMMELIRIRKENAELKRLLKLAVNELEERMDELCQITDFGSEYSPCIFCVNDGRCKFGDVKKLFGFTPMKRKD